MPRRSRVTLCCLTCMMALCVHQFRVLCTIPIGSIQAIKFGVFQRQLFAAVSTLAILLPPLLSFQLATNSGFTSLIVAEFFDDFSAIGKQQETVARC